MSLLQQVIFAINGESVTEKVGGAENGVLLKLLDEVQSTPVPDHRQEVAQNCSNLVGLTNTQVTYLSGQSAITTAGYYHRF